MMSLLFYVIHACVLWSQLLITLAQSQSECQVLSVDSAMSLQQAIDLSTSDSITSQTNQSCIRIEIPSGHHTILSQTLFPLNMEFIAVEEDVHVSCNYTWSHNYTWSFNGLDSVTISGIHFENCPRPLRLETIAEVEIQNCTFRYFTEAVLDIFNCHHTLFNSTVLEHNTGSGIVNVSYRGNTGGVSFGFNTLPLHFTTPSVQVYSSTFRNNSATASSAFLTSSQAFFAQIFTGRGGSMAVFSNESRHDILVNITDCVYESNFARSFGGGIYLLLGGFGTHHKIYMERTRVLSNIGLIGGGGVQASFFNNGLEDDPLLMAFYGCEVTNNSGIAGGGIFVFTSTDGGVGNLVQIRDTRFTGNRGLTRRQNDYGAALAISLLNPLVERSNFPRHEITDCTFIGNSGANGIISAGYSPMNFTGRNIFIKNNGTSLRVVGALVYLSGELQFLNNSGGDESALHMLSFAQIVLSRGLFINFEGNTGRFGCSNLIDSITTSTVYTRLPTNPQCPFLYEDRNAIPEEWTEVTVRFAGNTAILGSAIYMSRLDACSWYSTRPPFFNNTFLVDWPIWKIEPTNEDTGYSQSEQANSTLSVQTQTTKLVTSNSTVRAWPGLRLTIDVTGWDEFGHSTTATAGFSFQSFNDSIERPEVRFIPAVVVVGPDPITGLLTTQFTVYYGVGGQNIGEIEGLRGVVTIQDPIETLPVDPANFTLEALVCPAGYVLRPHSTQMGISVCTCNEEIRNLLLCEEDQETVVIRRGKWAVYVASNPQTNLEFYACPMGYCRCSHDSSAGNTTCVYSYHHSDPNLQCVCDRRGILCGECRDEGKGVSALLNNCVTCSNASGLLILALIVVDAVVFIMIVLLDKPLPSWTYPFIFYIQLAPIAGLDFPDSFSKVGKYLYFLGSGSGFYFIYDFCLYDEMSSEIAYFLRYLPLFVGILACAPVIIVRSWLYRRVLKRKPLKHHGLWVVVLLAYSHIVYTSMTILNCPSISDIGSRWHVNGEVKCFSGGHIGLALLAIVVLLAAVLTIPLLVLVAIGKLKGYGLKFFRPPLTLVYREHYTWWASVELGRRFLLLLFFVAFPQNEVVKVLVLALFTTVFGYIQPYRSQLANLLETAIHINFLFLLIINATSFFHNDLFIFSSGSLTDGSSERCTGSLAGIAHVTWILMPVYYLPVIGACVTATVLAVLFIRKWYLQKQSPDDTDSTDEYSDYRRVVGSSDHQSWTIDLPDDINEGFLDLHQTGKPRKRELSRRGRGNSNRTSFFNMLSRPPVF